MIRIIDIRKLALLAAIAALGAVGCTQNVTDGTSTQDDEIRRTTVVDVSGSNGGTAAHPTTRLGPHPDPWQGDDGNGPHPDPWSGRSGDGSGSGSGNPKPGDPRNPNQ
jgi:hypothetical protein